MRLSSATQIQPGIDVVMTTAEDSRQDYGTELVDDLKWSNNASLYTSLHDAHHAKKRASMRNKTKKPSATLSF